MPSKDWPKKQGYLLIKNHLNPLTMNQLINDIPFMIAASCAIAFAFMFAVTGRHAIRAEKKVAHLQQLNDIWEDTNNKRHETMRIVCEERDT